MSSSGPSRFSQLGSSNANPSLAASLPVEILDHILSFVFGPLDDTAKYSEKALSLVCHSWTRPVQRYALSSITFYSIYKFFLALNGIHSSATPFTKSIVTSCTISHLGHRPEPWDVMEEVLRTLNELPSLIKLELDIRGRLDFEQYELDLQLLNVKQLKITTPSKEALSIQEWKNIVEAMPNVSRLSLNGYYPWLDVDSPVPNVHLPCLTHLSVDSQYPFSPTQHLNFIADTTLCQIVRLDLDSRIDHNGSFRGGDSGADLPTWFTAMGPALRALSLPVSCYPADGYHPRLCQRALDACPNLVEVIIPQAVWELRLPPGVKTLRCVPTPGPDSYWKPDYDGVALHNLESWEGVERVLIECGEQSGSIWRGPTPRGVQVFINGVPHEARDDDDGPHSDFDSGNDQ